MSNTRRGIFGILGGLFAAPAVLEFDKHVPVKLDAPPPPEMLALVSRRIEEAQQMFMTRLFYGEPGGVCNFLDATR